jgi:phage-related protein
MAKSKKNAGKPTQNPTTQQKEADNGGGNASQLIDLLKRRKELESEILTLKKQILTEDKNDAEQVDRINRYEIQRTKHLKEYYALADKISKIRKQELEQLEKIQKIDREKEKLQKEEEHKIKQIKEHHEDIQDLQEKSQVLMRSLSEHAQKQASNMGLNASNARTLAEELQDANLQLTDSVTINKSFEKSMTSVMNVAKEMDSLEGQIAEGMQNSVDLNYQSIELYEYEKNLKMAIAELDINANKLGVERFMTLKKTLDSYEGQFKRIKKVNNELKDQSRILAKNKKENMSGATASDQSSIEKNTEKMGESFGESFNKSMQRGASKAGGWVDTIANKIKNAMSWAVDKIKNGLTSVFSFVWNLVSKVFSLFFSSITDVDKRMAETSRMFGVNRYVAADMERAFAKMALSANLIGQNAEQYRESANFLVESFGLGVENIMGGKEQVGIIKNMTTLRDSFQLTNEEATKFFELSVLTGTNMDTLAATTDKMSKGIMQSKTAFKAIANVPKIMALNIKTGLAGIAAFAAKVKMMGVDINKIQSMQDQFLDIESSLEKQFEAQVLTGVHIADMDRIRASALYGETDKMYDLILKNMGSVDQFKNLRGGITGQKAFAAQFGMEREEFIEMLTRGESLKKLGLSFQQAAKYQTKNAQELKQLAEEQKKAGNATLAGYLDNLAQSKQHAEIMAKIDDRIEKMKMQFAPAALRIIELINKVLDKLLSAPILGKIMDFMNNAVETFVKNLDDLISGKISFADLFKGIDLGLGDIFKSIFQDPAIKEFSKSLGLEDIGKSLEKVATELGKITGAMKGVTWLFEHWKEILGLLFGVMLIKYIMPGGSLFKFILGLGALTAAMYFLTDSFERLSKINVENLKDVGIIMGLMLGGLVGLGALAAGSGGLVAVGIIVIVGAFRALVGAIIALAEVADKLKPVFDFILKGFKQVYDFIYNIVKLLADFLIESLKQVGKLIVDVLYAIGNNVVNIIQQIQKLIESLVNTLKDAAVVILNTIGSVVQGIYNSIFNGILNVINGALDKVKEVTEVIKNSIVSVIESIKNAINTVANALVLVLDKVIEMIKTNPGNIERIAGAMSSISWSLLKMVGGSLFGSGSKLEDFMEIMHAAQAERIYAVADSIRYLSQTIRELSGTLGGVNINKLNAVVSRSQNTAPVRTGGGSYFESLMSGASSLWNNVTSLFTGGGNTQTTTRAVSPQKNYSVSPTTQPQYTGGGSQSQNVNVSAREMEKKLDAIITLLTNQSKKTAQIRFGARFIEEIQVELGAISDVYANVDNPKGKFLK